jgi:hypothetical protein
VGRQRDFACVWGRLWFGSKVVSLSPFCPCGICMWSWCLPTLVVPSFSSRPTWVTVRSEITGSGLTGSPTNGSSISAGQPGREKGWDNTDGWMVPLFLYMAPFGFSLNFMSFPFVAESHVNIPFPWFCSTASLSFELSGLGWRWLLAAEFFFQMELDMNVLSGMWNWLCVASAWAERLCSCQSPIPAAFFSSLSPPSVSS